MDELACVASVLLAIAFARALDVRNVSWAAFSGYMVMRGHVAQSLLRGILVGSALMEPVLIAWHIVAPTRKDELQKPVSSRTK